MKKGTQTPEYKFATRAVHVGNEVDRDSGAIKRPITMANSYALPYDPTDMNWSGAAGDLYTRNGGTNQKYLQERIASLGHDESLIVFLGENDERQYLYPEEFHNGFFRFSGGIEDAEDIINDLKQALEKVGVL